MLLKKGSKGEAVKQLQKILGCRPDGVFGPTTENLVKEWQKAHGLVVDGIVGDKTWAAMMDTSRLNDHAVGPGVVYNPINKCLSKKANRKIDYLVIHFTAGASSSGDAETKARNVFIARKNASADFTVDDDTMMQVNPDPKNYYTWAVGDGKGKYGVTNSNSVSIEICSNLTKGTTAKVPNHEGWYFTEASIDNAVELSKMIMKRYNIPLERVIRHYDASRKLCPGIIGWNPGTIYDSKTGTRTDKKSNEDAWKAFKARLV